jgi:hypothetical protein
MEVGKVNIPFHTMMGNENRSFPHSTEAKQWQQAIIMALDKCLSTGKQMSRELKRTRTGDLATQVHWRDIVESGQKRCLGCRRRGGLMHGDAPP